MVFSSIPAYLDPANWQQQEQPNHHHHHQTHETGGGNASNDPNHPLQLITSPSSSHHHQHVGGGGAAAGMLGSSIRPGSMAERARLANIPLPEAALKCPRCESTNTKFCYFNNYSLTQPRHFCKTCRRYWTRGGALRNVPVGGGCRRNKRSSSSNKSSNSSNNNNKSPVSSPGTNNNNSSSTSSTATVSPTANILGLLNAQQIPPLRFLSPLSQLSQHDHYNTTTTNPGGGGDIISLNYNGISGAPAATLLGSTSSHEMNFHNQLGSNNFLGLGGGCTSAYNSLLSSNTSIEPQWRLPFPNLLGGLDSSGLYHQFQGGSSTTTTSNVEPSSGGGTFGGGGGGTEMSHDDQVRPSNYKLSSSMLTQMASIKMEDMNQHHHHHHHELNLSRQLMGNIPSNNNDDNQWTTGGAAGTAAWTDLSSFSSSSTSNPL